MLAAGVLAMGLTVPVHAQATFTTLYNFNPNNASDGNTPVGALTISGNTLYGTGTGGGTFGTGVIYSINTDGTGYTVLHSFSALTGTNNLPTNSDGATPESQLVLSGDTLYGTAFAGGKSGYGAIFSVKTDGSDFTTIHSFTGNDGGGPRAGLILSGNTLYGTATYGGASNHGTVFSLKTDGADVTVLHSFDGSDGSAPLAGLALSGATLYGATLQDGGLNNGTLFSIGTNGSGFTTLRNFSGSANDGGAPQAALIVFGTTLYGVTNGGGANGTGTVFSLQTNGSDFNILHSFGPLTGEYTNSDGYQPDGTLVLSGNTLYGMTMTGGTSGDGTIFSVETSGTNFSLLYTFTGGSDGDGAEDGVILFGGVLYGVTSGTNPESEGTIFALNLNFSGPYEIQCVASGLAANVKGGSDTNGAEIIQWPFSGTGNEVWTFIPTSNGYYQINNIQSGLDLAVQNASTAEQAKIVQWSFGSTRDDQWKPELNSDGSYTLYNLKSGLALDDPSGSASQGTQFDQWPTDGETNQEFDLIPQ